MKTPLLINVPKDSPSRKEKLDAFKAKHQIETHNAGPGWGKANHPWSACLMSAAREMGEEYETPVKNIGDAVAHFCRLLDEAGLLVTGETERDAVRRLCEKNDIVFDL